MLLVPENAIVREDRRQSLEHVNILSYSPIKYSER